MTEFAITHTRLFVELLLVQPWVTPADVVAAKIATSVEEASSALNTLASFGLLVSEEEGYTVLPQIIMELSDLFPARTTFDRLRRRLRRDFDPSHERKLRRYAREMGTPRSAAGTLPRPPWHFDVKAIIFPAITVDGNLIVTDTSPTMANFVRQVIPDLPGLVASGGLTLESLLRRLDLHYFDYRTLTTAANHILDASGSYAGLLEELASHGYIRQQPVELRLSDGRVHYIEISMVTQRAFPGVQSVWYVIDQRVGYMKLFKAMRITKWFIAAHRLRQPVNLFNMARARLQVLESRLRLLTTDPEILDRVKSIEGMLTTGIADFRRFVQEVSRDDLRQLDKGIAAPEIVDIVALANETAADVDLLYASPASVHMQVQFNADDHGRYFVSADAYLLREALFNIVHNAFKHGAAQNAGDETRGMIAVSYEVVGDDFRLIVEDDGPGMSPETISALSRDLEHVSPALSPAEIGAVSGLVLSNFVVHSYGGRIQFADRAGGGLRTTVSIKLTGFVENSEKASSA